MTKNIRMKILNEDDEPTGEPSGVIFEIKLV